MTTLSIMDLILALNTNNSQKNDTVLASFVIKLSFLFLYGYTGYRII